MTVQELILAIERIAPPHLAEPWDNVGLIVGDPRQAVSRVMLTIDYTPSVAEEAREAGCDCIIAYHPPIFEPIRRLTARGA
ncbi:MAG: Nif3-like dinuclear metal center hexameric protein, partial [Phycisphaerae bacterium]|nr:Nif3-like dinuclear metal center hexameric protein [Phycisphaerae bacterium]MDW8263174.1 Nif3-like dinuclear metal center hexameric protein [Phycisphaerales bacterium]